MRMTRILLLAAFVGLAASLAYGQERATGSSRSDQLAAEREEKAGHASSPERSTVERALYWYDNQDLLVKIQSGWNGFRMASGGFAAGAGTTLGISYNRTTASPAALTRANRIELDTVAAYSTRGYTRTGGGVTLARIAGAPVDARVRAEYYRYPQEDFFGLGPDSSQEDRTSYLQQGVERTADVIWRPIQGVEVGGGVSGMRLEIGSGTDSRYPAIGSVVDTTTLPGFVDEATYLRKDASVAFDWRDNPLHPHAGGRYAVQYSHYTDQDQSQFGFNRIAIDLHQYVPLPNRYRTLALRAGAVLTDPHAGQEVPFYFQPSLGGSQTLRGFREFRFRDSNALMFTAEYRWEAAWLLDGALFVDAGQVAADRRDFNFRDLDVSYGVGFRIHSNRAFVARLDLAKSREGFIPLLRLEHVF